MRPYLKLKLILAVSLLLGVVPAVFASKLHPHAEWLKTFPVRHLTVTRYSGHPDFQSQRSLVWHFNGERFQSESTLHTRTLKGLCESVLTEQQQFPLQKMVATEYISPTDVQKFLEMSMSFQPGQVDFVQMSREVPEQEAYARFGNETYDRINHLVRNYNEGHEQKLPIVTATMWSVAGQVLNAPAGVTEHHPLPWQKEPERAELAAQFDRKKYPFVWEWGRTAQDLPGESEPAASALAAINYQELTALGGQLQEAYVMFHSFDERNTRAYLRRFPNSLFPSNTTDLDDALFLVPLADVLKAFPPTRYSHKFAQIQRYTDGLLTEESAMEFVQSFARIALTQLDFAFFVDRSSPPLVLHDMSMGANFRREYLFQEYQLHKSPRANDLAQYLLSNEEGVASWNSGQYVDLADHAVSQFYYHDKNAIEISNLDLRSLQQDPQYVEAVLVASFVFYLKAFVPGVFQPEAVQDTIRGLHQAKVRFGITTFSSEIARRVEALNPEDRQVFKYPLPEDGHIPEFEGQEWMSLGYRSPPTAFIFSIEQILEIIRTKPLVYQRVLNSAQENIWARHLMLTNPDIF